MRLSRPSSSVPSPRFVAAVALSSFALVACSSSTPSSTGGHPDGGGGGSQGVTDSGNAADSGGDPASLAADAYVWGYPLVVSERTLQNLGGIVGVDKLFNQTALSNDTTRVIVSPNQDTLYSVAMLDVSSEPVVLTVPDVTDRYWTYQFMDMYTNSFHYIGTRATKGKGGSFVITAPGWKGTLPAGAEQVASPTPQLVLLGRYLVQSTADIPNVTSLARKLDLLSTFTGTAPPSPVPALAKPKGTAQDVGKAGAAFFDELGDALAMNPPANDADRAHLARFASLGIGPGLHPTEGASAVTLSLLQDAVTAGEQRMADAASQDAKAVNGWVAHLDIGVYDDQPLLRAAVAKIAWAANVPEESVYPLSIADSTGQPYTGANRYVVHFDSGKLPPVEAEGFWSVTLYGPDRFFVKNAIQRFAIGDRTEGLAKNPDGSLDLYIQNAAPVGHEANWLPAPPSEFSLLMRVYLPGPDVLAGTYVYPGATRQ